MQGKNGSINLQHGSHVDLKFSVRHAKTKAKIKIPLSLTLFDLDQGPNGGCVESVSLSGFEKVLVTPNTEVIQKKAADGFTQFSSPTMGTGSDNPKDPMFLTSQQKD